MDYVIDEFTHTGIQGALIIAWTHEMVTGTAETIDPHYRLAVILGAGLGLRQGGVFGLSPDDVDFLRGTVRIRRQVLMRLFADEGVVVVGASVPG